MQKWLFPPNILVTKITLLSKPLSIILVPKAPTHQSVNSMRFVLLSFICFCSTLLLAQPSWGGARKGPTTKGKISGTAIDSLTQKPVEFAAVVIISPKDGKQINGTITEADGRFKIIEIPTGVYNVQLSFLGYEDRTLIAVETTPEKPDLDLGSILLQPAGLALDEVTVTAEASLIENRVDKLVYNAEKDATTSGGDGADVLRNVPLLSVDLEGNVSLRGSSNILILINGRPSTMFATSPADALRTIPADQIKSVEVITTPSAKYDGEGSAGIVNIITKKRNAQGFTGSSNVSIGTRQNNGGLNLNWVRGRFGLNGGANSFWSWDRVGDFEFYREDRGNSDPSILEQNGPSSSQVIGYNGNFGAFYDFNAYNSINSNIRLNGFNSFREGDINGSLGLLSDLNRPSFSRITDNESFRNGYDWTTDYRKTYPNSEREFTFAFQLSSTASNQENLTDQEGDLERYETDLLNANDGTNKEYTAQLDYVHPFQEGFKLETGLKSVIRRIDSDYDTQSRLGNDQPYEIFAALTDEFLYDQDVYAAYLSFNINLGKKVGLVAGARYEHTEIGGDYQQSENPSFTQVYDNVLPSIILSKQFENFSTLKGSFIRRIQRPSLFFINPFTQLANPDNITVGNPSLDPELVDQYEVSYGTFTKGVSINAALYYRETRDVIENYVQVDPLSNISASTYLNIGRNQSVGLNLFTSVKLKEIGSVRLGFNIFTYNGSSQIDSINLSRDAIIWSGNAGGSFNLPREWKADFFGFARSPNQTLQGETPSFWLYGIGIRKEFNKRLALGFRFIDPFNEEKSFPSEIEDVGFYQRSNFSIPFRSIGFSINYKFGQLDFKGNTRGRRTKIKNDDQKGGDGQNF